MSFWKDKKVLVTGHTGFKGSWLSLWLQSRGADVIGFSVDVPTHPSLYEVARVGDAMASVEGDIRDLGHVESVIEEYQPHVIFHLAAQPLVRYSYAHPVETYSTNVMGTVNVLEAARGATSVRAIVAVTSDKCYENKEWEWGYRETDELGGSDPYSSSKGCAEIVIASYRRSFLNADQAQRPVALASTRAGNVIGGGDWATDRLVPDVISAFNERRPVHIRNPEAIRPWQHVLAPLEGYLTLAEHLWNDGDQFAGGWNFGPGEEGAKPVLWITRRMQTLWGDGASVEYDTNEHPHEAAYLKLDSSKARSRLSWDPEVSIEQALRWTVDWYHHYYEKVADMRAFTLSQIAEYERRITRSSLGENPLIAEASA